MNKKWLSRIVAFLIMVCSVFGLAACTQEYEDFELVYEDDPDEFVTLVFYMPYLNSAKDIESVNEEINKITREEINAEVQIEALPYYEYSTRMSTIIGSPTRKFDICHTSPTINHYFLNVQREAFLPLDWLLPNYAPVTWAQVDEQVWEQARTMGHIYGSINLQVQPLTFTFHMNNINNFNDFLKTGEGGKYAEFTADTIYQSDVHKLQLMEEYLLWLSDNHRGLGGKSSRLDTEYTLQNYYGFDPLGLSMAVPGVVRKTDTLEDGKLEVINQFETAEYEELVEYALRWEQMGLMGHESRENDPALYDIVYSSTWKPGTVQTKENGDVRGEVRLNDPTYFTTFLLSTMNAISSTSEHPARAMKFIELMSTNVELHNLLQFGIEGKHYTKNEEGKVTMNVGTSYDNSLMGWAFGNEFNSYLLDYQDDDLWDQYREVNENGIMTDVIGFSTQLDIESQQWVSNCTAVFGKWAKKLSEGGYENEEDTAEALASFRAEMKAAGADEIIALKQKQLDEWVASNK